MTMRSRDTIFTPAFLDRLEDEDDSSAGASAEADWIGPWIVEPLGERWAVTAEGEDRPHVVAVSYDTAALAAALMPGVGRARLVRLGELAAPEGFPLLGIDGEILGHARQFVPDLAHALHVAECLRRSPLDLARFLYTTRSSGLARAGRILWIWNQAPPGQG